MRIFGALANGEDMTHNCQDQHCNALQPSQWMCFAVPLEWNNATGTPWQYLTVQLTRESEDLAGDPDLYGLFYGGTAGAGKAVDTATFAYDFRETSSSTHRSVVKKVSRHAFDRPGQAMDYTGVFICVKAYGSANLTYSLRAVPTMCPADFTPQGDQLLCSSLVGRGEQRHSGCSADGTCQCLAPYAKPVASVYDNLGFEDCSARVEEAEGLTQAAPFVAQHVQLTPKDWAFYSFNVTEDDYQVVVNVDSENDTHCTNLGYTGLFVKYGQPPGWRYGQWDFRPEWDYYSERESDLEIRFDATHSAWQTGRYFVGVNGDDAHNCSFTLSITKYSCPLNCSGRGTCQHLDNGTRTCLCDKGFFGADCGNEAARLVWDTLLARENAAFEYDFFQLPDLNPSALTHSIEVSIKASFRSAGYGQWSVSRPALLLLQGDHPSNDVYTLKQVLQEHNTTYEIILCRSQLTQGLWRAAIYNPMHIYKVSYNLTVSRSAACLNNCSQHGTCTADGLCHCEGDWTGGDCSVSLAHHCAQGTRRATPMPSQAGTCWQECHCTDAGACAFTSECVAFTCDKPGMRRRGTAPECVADECSQARWNETDAHVCQLPCNCPANGGRCTLGASCAPRNFTCKPGFARFSDGQPKCYKASCQEASLHELPGAGPVGGGRAFGVCRCQGEEREGAERCAVAQALSVARVVCDDGYALTGASAEALGGTCVPVRRGTAAWAVVLWALFAALLGVGAGGGLLWWYEQRLKRAGLNEALFELALDQGF
ncbi:hypothetical protein WJX81_002486 [Elliptochloris bilobata]|uniref:EGF-like domain-containing protein n=1 Tax=Elliptochloris bilobata TaxID=381761 RepID=A0AAW1SAG4_9CHLO